MATLMRSMTIDAYSSTRYLSAKLIGHAQLHNGQLAAWFARRQEQIERHELPYIAHQLDVLGQLP
jgi:hypothetical protein